MVTCWPMSILCIMLYKACSHALVLCSSPENVKRSMTVDPCAVISVSSHETEISFLKKTKLLTQTQFFSYRKA